MQLKANEMICQSCWNNLAPAASGEQIFDELKNKFSAQCCFSQVLSLWQFSPEAQTIIHYLKYRSFRNLANKIGKAMAHQITTLNLPEENVVLIPVPLHSTRIRERGFNQSYLLCQALATETAFALENFALKRVRYTSSQTKLSAAERQKNVKNAFVVIDKKKVVNKTIVLVDDVITTGATMNACAGELLRHGASEIILLSAVKA
jgi:ComF family protein